MEIIRTLAEELSQNQAFRSNDSADFHPILAGKISPTEIHLMDAFGQEVSGKIKPDTKDFVLNPRLLQSSKLSVLWRAKEGDLPAGKLFPAASPIRAWVLPAFSDKAIGFFDPEGTLLCWIDENHALQFPAGTERWAPVRECPE